MTLLDDKLFKNF